MRAGLVVGNNVNTRIVIMRKKIGFALLTSSLLLPAGLFAQSGAGSIQGTVQDPSSAIIAGCSVHVLNQRTGVTNDTTSNGSGFYSVPGLFAGTYTVTFSAPGMKKYQTVVPLQDAQVAVLNPKLTVGDVAEQVTVSGDTIQLATYDSGTVSKQLEANRIDQLPQMDAACWGSPRIPCRVSRLEVPDPTDLCRRGWNIPRMARL
jgi:carboxypeptidase family protein